MIKKNVNMIEVVSFETFDGELFDNLKDAEAHELEIRLKLTELPHPLELSEIVYLNDEDDLDEGLVGVYEPK